MRFLVLASVLALAFLLAACGDDPELRIWNNGPTAVTVTDEDGRETIVGSLKTVAVLTFDERTLRRLVLTGEDGVELGVHHRRPRRPPTERERDHPA